MRGARPTGADQGKGQSGAVVGDPKKNTTPAKKITKGVTKNLHRRGKPEIRNVKVGENGRPTKGPSHRGKKRKEQKGSGRGAEARD